MAGPYTAPVAEATPFEASRNPDFNNGLSPITAENVQDAIEQALFIALASSNYLTLGQYNGNANSGRVLEFFTGINSDDAPLVFGDGTTKVLSITMSTTSMSSSAVIGFYNKDVDPNYNTPLFSLDMDGQKTQQESGTIALPVFSIPPDALLVVKVDSGSIQKPHFQLILSAGV